MAEIDKLSGKRWHPNACVQLDMEPPKKSSFYGWNPRGPILPARSKEERARIKEQKRERRGVNKSEEQIVFVHEGLPEDIRYGSPIPNPDNKLPNEALRDYLDSLGDEAGDRYEKYHRKLGEYYDGPGGP